MFDKRRRRMGCRIYNASTRRRLGADDATRRHDLSARQRYGQDGPPDIVTAPTASGVDRKRRVSAAALSLSRWRRLTHLNSTAGRKRR